MLWFMGSQRVGHDWLTELNWKQTYLQIYRVRKANLVTDYRLVKVKVKHRSDQTCSLFSLSSLFSGKKKKKKISFLFFPFSLQHFHWLYLFLFFWITVCTVIVSIKDSDSLWCSLKIQLEFYHQKIYNYMSHFYSSVAGGTPVILLSQGLAASENRKRWDQSSVQSQMTLDRGR